MTKETKYLTSFAYLPVKSASGKWIWLKKIAFSFSLQEHSTKSSMWKIASLNVYSLEDMTIKALSQETLEYSDKITKLSLFREFYYLTHPKVIFATVLWSIFIRLILP